MRDILHDYERELQQGLDDNEQHLLLPLASLSLAALNRLSRLLGIRCKLHNLAQLQEGQCEEVRRAGAKLCSILINE